MSSPPPWDIVPLWREMFFRFIASLAANVRGGVLDDLTKPGDDAWSIGCVFLNRWRSAVVSAADEHEWLTIIDPSLKFVFAIAGVPIRLFRAKDEECTPPPRTRERDGGEVKAHEQLCFSFALETDWFWRIRMVTTVTESIDALIVEQINEYGATRNSWRIPLDEGGETLGGGAPPPDGGAPPPIPMARPPVPPPPLPDFELREDEGKDDKVANK